VNGLQIICTKVRDGNNRIVRLKEGEPQGRHVVIVDDLVQSGGTLIECQVCSSIQACLRICMVKIYLRHLLALRKTLPRLFKMV
jgi:phosphoribosylpyrophosphate synthetase